MSGVKDLLAERLEGSFGNGIRSAALDNFVQTFGITAEDKVLLLLDNEIDPRVPKFVWDFARGRGAQVAAFTVQQSGASDPTLNSITTDIPDQVKPLAEWATFVVSTWFSSTMHPYFKQLRRKNGQRWVKITYFRSLDLLASEAAAFPLPIISALLQKTASRYPTDGDATLRVTDTRGTDLTIVIPQDVVKAEVLTQSRWRGELTADKPGCYVHYLPTHGPNLYSGSAVGPLFTNANGVVKPQCAVGFDGSFDESPEIVIEDAHVTKVNGSSAVSQIFQEMLPGARLEELGCGFNPKWPRTQLYPAGSNSPGALHVGLDLLTPHPFIQKALPHWPEPPVHIDSVILDATVTINGTSVVEEGRLSALRDPAIVELASRYGDPVELLENWPA